MKTTEKATETQSVPSLHGIEYPALDCAGRFRFAIWRFCGHLDHSYQWRFRDDPKPPPWPGKYLDRTFTQAWAKLNDTFHKLLRVAGMVEATRQDIGEYKDSRKIAEFSRHMSGLRDMPIYLDSILFYLRILPDCVATITPYLYGNEGKKANIAHWSFRKHRKWFVLTCPTFDPAYTEVLSDHTGWFDLLAGKKRGEGLRDKIVHHHGTFRMSYTVDDQSQDTEVTAGLINEYGWISDNIFPELKRVVRGLFVFLDSYVEHFNYKVGEQTGSEPIDLTVPHLTEAFRFNEPLPAFWLFPEVDRTTLPVTPHLA